MEIYECVPCGYTTNRISNIKRHNATMKHLKIIQILNDEEDIKKVQIKKQTEEFTEKKLIIDLNKQIDNLKAQNELLTKKQVKKKEQISKSLKKAIWDKYIGQQIGESLCLCCELQKITQLAFHCGHIIPESKGGSDSY